MTQPATHYEAHLQRDVNRLRGKVTDMARLGERALRDSLKALLEGNRPLAYLVILRDQHIDELEKEIDRLCLEFLVRNQPVAGLLRFVYVTMKINRELERIGDYSESIARQSLKLAGVDFQFLHAQLEEIAGLSIPMFHDAVEALLNQNAELARKTSDTEAVVDAVRNRINTELVKAQQEGRIPLEALAPLMTVARRFERVADQAQNICEEAIYATTGEYTKHQGIDTFRILFVDADNGSLSQMAAAIGNAMGQAKFLFTSAGASARPLPEATREFLASKGLPCSLASKTIAQVPNLEYYQVVVAFDKAASAALDPAMAKGVKLDWNAADPGKVQGTPAEVAAAHEKAFSYLSAHINDLAQAILGIDIDSGRINDK